MHRVPGFTRVLEIRDGRSPGIAARVISRVLPDRRRILVG
jgi:hypothetical protein